MARFIDYNPHQTVLLPISFEQQILPGTFEYTLSFSGRQQARSVDLPSQIQER